MLITFTLHLFVFVFIILCMNHDYRIIIALVLFNITNPRHREGYLLQTSNPRQTKFLSTSILQAPMVMICFIAESFGACILFWLCLRVDPRITFVVVFTFQIFTNSLQKSRISDVFIIQTLDTLLRLNQTLFDKYKLSNVN